MTIFSLNGSPPDTTFTLTTISTSTMIVSSTFTVWVTDTETTFLILENGMIQEFYMQIIADGTTSSGLSQTSLSPMDMETISPSTKTDCPVITIYTSSITS